MSEQTVWRGTSSQLKNFGRYLLSAVLGIVVIVVFATLRNSDSPQLSNVSLYVLLLLVVPILMA